MFRTRADVSARNERFWRGAHAHGIRVYADVEPIGWSQYGTSDELIEPKGAPRPRERTWRITCFAVDRRFPRKGVAAGALHAALESIRRQGGGLVQAFSGCVLVDESKWLRQGS